MIQRHINIIINVFTCSNIILKCCIIKMFLFRNYSLCMRQKVNPNYFNCSNHIINCLYDIAISKPIARAFVCSCAHVCACVYLRMQLGRPSTCAQMHVLAEMHMHGALHFTNARMYARVHERTLPCMRPNSA